MATSTLPSFKINLGFDNDEVGADYPMINPDSTKDCFFWAVILDREHPGSKPLLDEYYNDDGAMIDNINTIIGSNKEDYILIISGFKIVDLTNPSRLYELLSYGASEELIEALSKVIVIGTSSSYSHIDEQVNYCLVCTGGKGFDVAETGLANCYKYSETYRKKLVKNPKLSISLTPEKQAEGKYKYVLTNNA